MKQEEEKCCGNCCWFYGEDTYGFGVCPFQFGEIRLCEQDCGKEDEFVSKGDMRHHRAVLLQYQRWLNSTVDVNILRPSLEDIDDSLTFAHKYMKIFSEL